MFKWNEPKSAIPSHTLALIKSTGGLQTARQNRLVVVIIRQISNFCLGKIVDLPWLLVSLVKISFWHAVCRKQFTHCMRKHKLTDSRTLHYCLPRCWFWHDGRPPGGRVGLKSNIYIYRFSLLTDSTWMPSSPSKFDNIEFRDRGVTACVVDSVLLSLPEVAGARFLLAPVKSSAAMVWCCGTSVDTWSGTFWAPA